MTAVLINEESLNVYEGIEFPSDNENLKNTCGSFKRACTKIGGVPQAMFQPVLLAALDCLSGITSMYTMKHFSIQMLFFVACFLDSEVLMHFICFDLLAKDTCVDILLMLRQTRDEHDFLIKTVLNYFQSEIRLAPAYVQSAIANNPRKLRWEVMRINGSDHNLNRMSRFPTTCNVCNKTIMAAKHLSLTEKCVYTSCCYSNIHVSCLLKIMEDLFGNCPFCQIPMLKGHVKGITQLGQILKVAVVRTNGVPPTCTHESGEVFRFLDPPHGRRDDVGITPGSVNP